MAAQLDFSGGEHPYGPQFNQADPGLASRLDKAQRNRGVFSTYAKRTYGDAPLAHTSAYGLAQAWDVPRGASFHEHPKAARYTVGHVEEVPLYNYAEDRPSVSTLQTAVDTGRLNQIANDPRSGASPRYPARLGVDLPFAYRGDQGRSDPVLIDGNHRTTASILQGQMFQPMRVITDRDVPQLRANTKRINQAKVNTEERTGITPQSGWMHPLTFAESDKLHGETSSS